MRTSVTLFPASAARSLALLRISLFFAICAALIPLAGCTVGPEFETPAAPPVASYLPDKSDKHTGTVKFGADVSGRWWTAYGSPAINSLVEQAFAHNPDIAAAEAALRVSQANLLVQRAALFPVVNGSFDNSRQQNPKATTQTPDASGANIYSLHTAQLTISYVPDVFGGTRRAIEGSRAMVEAQAFQREGVYLTLSTNVVATAIQAASLRSQIAAINRLIGLQGQLLSTLRKQNAAGQIAEPDVAAQETAVAQTRLLLAPLERQLAQQNNLLSVLIGRFPGNGVPARLMVNSIQRPKKLPLSLPADFVRQRPDVRAAEANLHAANAQIGVALANRLPQITLTGNLGSSSNALGNLFSPGTLIWTVAGGVAQPIFNAGALENKQRAAEAATDQAAAQYRSTLLTAFQNVADVLRALQIDDKAIAAAAAAERAAGRNFDLLRKQLELGQISLPLLIPAQQAYVQTVLARIQTESLRLSDTVALFQALGGGWWNRPGPLTVAAPEPNIVLPEIATPAAGPDQPTATGHT